MEKLREYKYIILLQLVILGFAFYWFEYRPIKIKEKCSADARFDSRADSLFGDDYKKFINDYYDDCLMRFGLK